ncbi:MAG: protein-glutamate O-methyltransferase CheR [Myxococcota bacterium]
MNAATRSALELSMTDAEYAAFGKVIEHHLGIRLPPEKRLLVERRMQSVVARSGCESYRAWAATHLDRPTQRLWSDLADALTTNHTFFWREPGHFEHLRDVSLPERLAARRQERDLRVWCAASATGEEPYQLAMILRDGVPADWRAGLLATDVSAKALDQARRGTYPADHLAALPEEWRRKYVQFDRTGAGTMSAPLKGDVTFRRLNLIRDTWPFRTQFDIVFCRNVLIYFDPPVRDRVVTGIVDLIAPGGYLYVGHAESLPAGKWPLTSVAPSVWRRGPGRAA